MTCKTCKGTGESICYENQAPLGSGLVWNEAIANDCPNCTAEGICPRCDTTWDDNIFDRYLDSVSNYKADRFHCPFCDWIFGEVAY